MSEEILTGRSANEEASEPISEEIAPGPTVLKQSDGSEDNSAEIQESELSLEQRLSETEAKAAEYLDGWQRARAEFANARKRLERERMEAYNNAAVDYAKKLLPILDDFDRALGSVPEAIEKDSWFEGLALVRRKLNGLLEELNVEPIQAIGRPFDPNIHEALTLMEADGVDSGVVVEELQTGYRIGDRIIRPSLVSVAA